MNRISVIGTGYVGLVTGACLAEFGHNVTCMDIDGVKIDKLKEGVMPIYEQGLDILVANNVKAGRLHFTTEIKQAVENGDTVFIAVGTPPKEDGSADLQYVLAAARSIAEHMKSYHVIVNKSTVPVGTGRKVKQAVAEVLARRGIEVPFDVVSNPEFLREGVAIKEFLKPDRIVIGCDSKAAEETMKSIYRVLFLNNNPFVFTNIETAELIKYASNAFLANKIAFVNELSGLCEAVGADVQDVSRAMGLDGRIGKYFLHAGPGYGGSCFPKDTKALIGIGREFGCDMEITQAVVRSNERQKLRMVDKVTGAMGGVDGKTIAVLGLAFKPETDDMREAPSITLINELVRRGAEIRAYDPAAMENARNLIFEGLSALSYAQNEYECVTGADAVVIVTEWNRFRSLDLERIRKCMKDGFFFDLRNIYEKDLVESFKFKYYGVGK
jgi:UDPglucose 6-dehydrogenase